MVRSFSEEVKAKPAAILLTHGHFDHITAVPALLKEYPGTPVYAYKEERVLLEDARINESASMGRGGIVLQDVRYLEDGAGYFLPSAAELVNDTFLGLSTVVLALVVWIVIVLIKDPEHTIRSIISEKR